MIIKTLKLGPTDSNCYVIGCPDTLEGAVIDPGWDAKTILNEVAGAGLTITYVLNTHAHWDVTSANAELLKATGARLAVHPLDVPLLRNRGGAELWGIRVKASPEPDLELTDGQIIPIGNLALHVLHTPGHTPGHVSLHEPQEKVVFTGDTLYRQGVGRHDLPGGNYRDLRSSVQDRLLALPADTTVYSSHGPPTTIGEEQGIEWFRRRTGRLGALPTAQPVQRSRVSLPRVSVPQVSLPRVSLPRVPLPLPLSWIGAIAGLVGVVLMLFFLRGALSMGASPTVTPTATLTATPSATPTTRPSATATATAAPPATSTRTPVPTPTRTPQPTRTPAATGTATPTQTATGTPTATATATSTPTPTATRFVVRPTSTPVPPTFTSAPAPTQPPATQPPPTQPPPTQPPPTQPPPTQPPPTQPPPTQPPPTQPPPTDTPRATAPP